MKKNTKFYPEIKELFDKDENLSKIKNDLTALASLLKEKIKEIEVQNNISKNENSLSKNKKKALRKKYKK